MHQRIDALLLVGGFSGSEYLFKRVDVCTYSTKIIYLFKALPRSDYLVLSITIAFSSFITTRASPCLVSLLHYVTDKLLSSFTQDQFGQRIKVIARPSDADTATCRGAAQYGLARRPLVSSVIAPRSYLMKVSIDPAFPSRALPRCCRAQSERLLCNLLELKLKVNHFILGQTSRRA